MGSRIGALFLLWLLPACYFAELGAHQLELVNQQRPLPAAFERETDPERRRMLALVPELRAYGRDRMQLPLRGSYAGYYATEARGIMFVVVGSERTRLAAYHWWFPIVGKVAYKSFVTEAEAREAADELERDGYDAWVGRVTAYSTLGFFRDPVTSVMMREGVVAFVEVLLHEMSHARLYAPGHTDWNEQLASFAGRMGAHDYLRSRHGNDPAVMAELALRDRRRIELELAVRATLRELDALYASKRAEADVLRLREQSFARLSAVLERLHPDDPPADHRVNNARLLQFRRYITGAELFERVWAEAGASWPRFWALCEARAQLL